MRRSTKALLGAAALSLLVGAAVYVTAPRFIGAPSSQSMEYLTPTIKVDGIYPSMLGPSNTDLNVTLTKRSSVPELLWVTGYRADMVGPQENEPRSSRFAKIQIPLPSQ